MAMKYNEVQSFVKNSVVNELGLPERGTEIGRGKYVIPVNTPENGVVYATVTVTCTRFQGTEKAPAFDLDAAVAKYEAEENERAERAAERAEKAAQKAAEKAAKKAEKDAE